MYSYEERLRAVKLYIKLGKRGKATMRQLGYPTKQALASWYREFLSHGSLKPAYVRSEPRYSDEQKRVAVEHYIDHGRCFALTRKALGYPGKGTLNEWVYERHPELEKYVVGKAGRPAASLASKRAAVYELCTREGSAQKVAQRMDVDRVTLYNWKNSYLVERPLHS